MAQLYGTRVSATLGDVLQISNSGSGVDGTLRAVSSGQGTSSALSISTTAVQVTGNFTASGTFSVGSIVASGNVSSATSTVSGNATIGGTLGVTGNVTLSGTTLTATTSDFSIKGLTASGAATFSSTLSAQGITSTTLSLSGALTSSSTLSGTALTVSSGSGAIKFSNNGTPTIVDYSNNNLLSFVGNAGSAVNYLKVTNNTTGNVPSLVSVGDTNIGLQLAAAGTGNVILGTTTGTANSGIQIGQAGTSLRDWNGNILLRFNAVANATSSLLIKNGNVLGSLYPTLQSTDQLDIVASGSVNLKSNLPLKLYDSSNTYYTQLNSVSGITAARTITFPDCDVSKFYVQRQSNTISATAGISSTIPADNTIPQNTEGSQIASVTITPKNANNTLIVRAIGSISKVDNGSTIFALFRDSTANAVAATVIAHGATTGSNFNQTPFEIIYSVVAGSTASTTFYLRAGIGSGNQFLINANGSFTLGGIMPNASIIDVVEYSG